MWLRDCVKYWAIAGVPHTHFHIRKANTAPTLISNICDSFALYIMLWLNAVRSRNSVLVTACAGFLGMACLRVQEVAEPGRCCWHRSESAPWATSLVRTGEPEGAWLACGDYSLLAVQLAQSVILTWSRMHGHGVLAEPFEQDEHELSDIVHFALFCLSERRSRQQTVGTALLTWLDDLRFVLVRFLAGRMDIYIKDVYLVAHRSNKPAPAFVSPRKAGKRQYVQVQPETVWSLINCAREVGVSLPSARPIQIERPGSGL